MGKPTVWCNYFKHWLVQDCKDFCFIHHSLLADYLFENEVDYDDYDDITEENSPFSDLPLSTVTPADIEGRVRSLEEIFSSLHISSEGCQKMLVCHLSKVTLFFCQNIFKTFFVTRIGRSLVLCPTWCWTYWSLTLPR